MEGNRLDHQLPTSNFIWTGDAAVCGQQWTYDSDCCAATAFSATSSVGGRRRFLLDARRRIPRQALGLKKYFCRCSPGISKTSDNEDSTAALGDSEVLSVQHSPRDAIPDVNQRFDDGCHVPSSVN